jgi:hypothetical protein
MQDKDGEKEIAKADFKYVILYDVESDESFAELDIQHGWAINPSVFTPSDLTPNRRRRRRRRL